MVFLLFMYTTLLWGRPKTPLVSPVKSKSPYSLDHVSPAPAHTTIHENENPHSTFQRLPPKRRSSTAPAPPVPPTAANNRTAKTTRSAPSPRSWFRCDECPYRRRPPPGSSTSVASTCGWAPSVRGVVTKERCPIIIYQRATLFSCFQHSASAAWSTRAWSSGSTSS